MLNAACCRAFNTGEKIISNTASLGQTASVLWLKGRWIKKTHPAGICVSDDTFALPLREKQRHILHNFTGEQKRCSHRKYIWSYSTSLFRSISIAAACLYQRWTWQQPPNHRRLMFTYKVHILGHSFYVYIEIPFRGILFWMILISRRTIHYKRSWGLKWHKTQF